MVLADAYANYRDELVADFQSEYGVNICAAPNCYRLEGDATDSTIVWLATLAAQLPESSRVARAVHPENDWTVNDYILRNLEYSFRLFCWAMAGGEKSGPKPEPIYSPSDITEHESMVEEAERMAASVAAVLGIERG